MEELLDYSRGLASESRAGEIGSHLDTGCEACAENLGWLEEVGRLAATDLAPDIPEETIKGMVAWFRSQPIARPRTMGERIAQLLFDSMSLNRAAFVREGMSLAQPSAGRQMLFQSDAHDIDLRFEALEDQARENLIGQILARDGSAGPVGAVTVRLSLSGQEDLVAVADAQGIFRFADLPSGIYEIGIGLDDLEIVLPQVASARMS